MKFGDIDPFCDKEAYSKNRIFKTKHFNVLYDIKPVMPGHILFVPIRHVPRLIDLTPTEFDDLGRLTKKIIPMMTEAYASEDSHDVIIQIGKYSGASISHVHIHLVPRRKDDKYRMRDDALYKNIELRTENLGPEFVRAEVRRFRKMLKYKEE